jgi:tetratricopeptide (TPR) repeat protein
MSPEDRRDAARDQGMALALAARILSTSMDVARVPASQAVPLLTAAVRERPDDLSAAESLGLMLGMLDFREEALRAYESVLRVNPGRELALRSSGRVLGRIGRPGAARAALEKTIAVDPWRSDYHLALATACYHAGDWPAAVAACREAIRLNPELIDARSLLVQCYLRSNEPEKADGEFQILVRFYPASRDVWQEWYEQQKRAGITGADLHADGEPFSADGRRPNRQ